VHIALGGSFSLFLVYRGPGCVLLQSGCLGIDITRDTYGYNTDTESAEDINGQIDDEMREVRGRDG